jgi:OmcA/MtrC family decaheme c-type cytochrome
LGAVAASGLIALMLVSCNGGSGSSGTNGTNGSNTTPVSVASSSYDQTGWAGLTLSGQVTGVTFTGADGGTPVVTFTVTDGSGNPVTGLANFTASVANAPVVNGAPVTSYPNFAFSIAKLIPGTAGGPSQWLSYIVTTTPSVSTPAVAPNHPSSDNTGTLTESTTTPGTYTYKFFRDIAAVQAFLNGYTYSDANHTAAMLDASQLGFTAADQQLTHRVTVMVGGAFRNTGSNTANGVAGTAPAIYPMKAANLIYDFIPATGLPVTAANTERLITDTAACNACHTQLGVTFHTGGEMNDPRYCVVCHTDQQKYGSADASGSITYTTTSGVNTAGAFPVPTANTSILNLNGMATGALPAFIHRIHNGSNNFLQNFQFNSGLSFNSILYPQDVRNCATCHVYNATTTPQANNWYNVPSIAACQACHDNVNLVTGVGHEGGQKPDGSCASCHTAQDIQVDHTPVLTAAQVTSYGNTATWYQATNPSNMPSGAHSISATVNSVTIAPIALDTTDLGNPVINFTLHADGNTAVALALAAQPGASSPTNLGMLPAGSIPTDALASFVGGPSLLLAMGYPQDGIAPADYNYETTVPLVKIWNKSGTGSSAGTLSTQQANGSYSVTLTGIVVPSGTNLMVGGLGEGSSLVQTNLGKVYAPYTGQANVLPQGVDYSYNSTANTGGLMVSFPTVWASASFATTYGGSTKSIARRTIVANDACNTCHSNLGAFTGGANFLAPSSPSGAPISSFHSAGNNDATSCAICHNTSAGSHANVNGYSINAKDWVHALHASGFRTYPYTGQANFPFISFPGVLNNCEACHVPGSYDFSDTASAAQGGNNAQFANNNLLWDTVAGTVPATAYPLPANSNGSTLAPTTYPSGYTSYYAPWVFPTFPPATGPGTAVSLGTGMVSSVPGAGGVVAFTQPSATSLVTSPITAACSGCHDTPDAVYHMENIGNGFFYRTRAYVATKQATRPPAEPATVTVNGVVTTPLTNTVENCMNCHSSQGPESIREVHMNINGFNPL